MSTFQIDDEIDKLVDKLTEQFKTRLKKLVTRSEKLVLKQYIASQKETMRAARGTKFKPSKPKPKPKPQPRTRLRGRPAKVPTKSGRKVRREKDYEYEEFVSSSDEGY